MMPLIVFGVRPVRRDRSFCLMPKASRVSLRVSPGAEATSPWYSYNFLLLFMCVLYPLNHDTCHAIAHKTSIIPILNIITRRPYNQAIWVIQVQRYMSLEILLQLMAASCWQCPHVNQRIGSL